MKKFVSVLLLFTLIFCNISTNVFSDTKLISKTLFDESFSNGVSGLLNVGYSTKGAYYQKDIADVGFIKVNYGETSTATINDKTGLKGNSSYDDVIIDLQNPIFESATVNVTFKAILGNSSNSAAIKLNKGHSTYNSGEAYHILRLVNGGLNYVNDGMGGWAEVSAKSTDYSLDKLMDFKLNFDYNTGMLNIYIDNNLVRSVKNGISFNSLYFNMSSGIKLFSDLKVTVDSLVEVGVTEYKITDEKYVRILGRGELYSDGSRTFNWPNAGIEFEFNGKRADVYVSSSTEDISDYNGNFFNVAVYKNNELDKVKRIRLYKGWNNIYTSENEEEVKIMLVRSSEACRGTLRFSKLRTDKEPKASNKRNMLIEFIGDSYTAGYGNSPELTTYSAYCAANTDNWNSYTGFVARHFNADNNVIAYQGKGIYYNIDNKTDTMPELFNMAEIATSGSGSDYNMSTKATWDFSTYKPDYVTVFLGTNDNGAYSYFPTEDIATNFQNAYIEFLNTIKSNYENTPILCITKPSGSMGTQVENAVNYLGGEENGIYLLTLKNFSASSLGHPNIKEQNAIANEVITALTDIMNKDKTTIEVKKNGKIINALSNLTAGDSFEVGIFNSKKDKKINGLISICQYDSSNILQKICVLNASGGFLNVKLTDEFAENTDKIKVIYVDKTTLEPITSEFELQ